MKEIVANALDLPPDERATYIARACGGAPGLQEDVGRLVLAGDDQVTGPLDRHIAITQSAPELAAGELLAGRFRIKTLLARGGMGEVYCARDEELREDVALKIISRALANQPGMVNRFRLEVQRARRITHPNVCRIHDLFFHVLPDGATLHFLSMQLINGPTLAAWMRRSQRLSLPQATQLLRNVIAGLSAAHEAGIAHSDLKPNNILLDRAEEPMPRAIITDFGLARALRSETGADETTTLINGGTPAYMAPELRFGTGGVTGDIFALGVIAYELLTGRHPFGGKPVWEMEFGFRPPAPRSVANEIPAEWDAVVMRCLEPEPQARFADLAELRAIVAGETSSSYGGRILRRALPYAAAGLVTSAAGVLGYLRWSAKSEVVAVLPFENASRNDALDYLSDGITENLINRLSRLSRLRVPAVGLVRRFKGDAVPTRAGRILNASAVLTGRLSSREGVLSAEVELIEVASGRQIWGRQYNLAFTNLLDVQESICDGILSGLQIPEGEVNTLRRGFTKDEEAFQLFLRGQYLLGLRTEESLNKARDLFTQAVERDPKFALAYSGLASSRVLLGYFGAEPALSSMPAARVAAERALSLEATVAEAYGVIGFVKAVFDWDWHGAEDSFRKAIALKENVAEAHHWYAIFVLNPLARHDEARAEMQRALSSDPSAVILHTNLGLTLYVARRFDEAIAQLQRVIQMNSRFVLPYWTLGQAWAAKGNLAKAVEVHEDARRLQPGAKPDLSLAFCYAVCGQPVQARVLLDEALRKYARPSYSAVEVAYVQGALDDSEAAFRSLELAWSNKEPQLIDIGVDPKFDSLRNHSAFPSILRRINLNPAAYHFAALTPPNISPLKRNLHDY